MVHPCLPVLILAIVVTIRLSKKLGPQIQVNQNGSTDKRTFQYFITNNLFHSPVASISVPNKIVNRSKGVSRVLYCQSRLHPEYH